MIYINIKHILNIVSLFVVSAIISGCTTYQISSVEIVNVVSKDNHCKDTMLREIERFNNTIGKAKNMRIILSVKDIDYNASEEIMAGEGPDIPSETYFGENTKYLYPINELPDGGQFIEEYSKKIGREIVYGDNAPVYYMLNTVATMGFIYNKDLFRKAGIVDETGEPMPPVTYDEVRSYSRRISELGYKTYGIAIPLKWVNWFTTDVISGSMSEVGRKEFDPLSGKYDFKPYKPVLEMYKGIREDRSYFPGALNLDNDAARAQFAEGRVGMKWAGSWDAGVLNDQFPAKCDWGVSEIPISGKNEKKYAHYGEEIYGMSITKKSVERHGGEIMLEAMKFFYSDDYVRNMFIDGKTIPCNMSLVENIDPVVLKPGWNEFVELAKKGRQPNVTPSVKDVLNEKEYCGAQNMFIQEVWNGNKSVDELIEQLDYLYNKALDEGVKNGKIDLSLYTQDYSIEID